jgi:hypothetical protein
MAALPRRRRPSDHGGSPRKQIRPARYSVVRPLRAGDAGRAAVQIRRLAGTGREVTSTLLAPAAPVDGRDAASPAMRAWARLRGSQRFPGLRTMKVTLATVVAYLAAEPLPSREPPIVAALTALLVVQFTFYQTVKSGWQRIGAVLTGVLVAVLLSTVFGLTWWSLGVTVLAALVVGQWLRLGDHAAEVPISAMLVLAVGSQNVGVDRVYETLIGTAVGVLASLLTPPVYVQPAGDAIGSLAARISTLLHSVADGLVHGWTRERATEALETARALEHRVLSARDALLQAEDSVRLNPRARRAAHIPQTLRSGLTALEYSVIDVRVICRFLLDRVEGVPDPELPGADEWRPLARLLDAAADAMAVFGELVASDVEGPTPDDDRLRQALTRARSLRDAANRMMLVDAQRHPEIWRMHGAVLGIIDRLLVEIDPDATNAALAIKRPLAEPSTGEKLSKLSMSVLRRRSRQAATVHRRAR